MLDANFIINLQHVSGVDILTKVAKKNDWIVHMGTIVKSEVTEKRSLNHSFSDRIEKKDILLTSCNNGTFRFFKGQYTSLGDGELESIAIAYDCPTKLVRPYIILSDDTQAKNKAKILGINFLGIVSFFVLANKQGFLNKKKALEHVDLLKGYNFALKQNVYEKFVSALI